MSLDRLIDAVIEKNNPTVVGLDPKLEYIPEHLKKAAFAEFGEGFDGAAAAVLAFNKGLIDAVCDIVPAVKPQCAYYEMYGWQGVRALRETIEYARKKGLFVITDGKRNDIGSTMEAYAAAHLGVTELPGGAESAFGGDALTVNGYLGTDGIAPLLDICKKYDKGVFVLVKTSNPSSGELQDIKAGERTVYEIMGDSCEGWGAETAGKYGYSAVGAVVGATFPAQLTELRKRLPHTFFLVPGYGAQGGSASAIRGAFDSRGLGAVVNSSRAVMCAYMKSGGPRMYQEAARDEVLRMKKELLEQSEQFD